MQTKFYFRSNVSTVFKLLLHKIYVKNYILYKKICPFRLFVNFEFLKIKDMNKISGWRKCTQKYHDVNKEQKIGSNERLIIYGNESV